METNKINSWMWLILCSWDIRKVFQDATPSFGNSSLSWPSQDQAYQIHRILDQIFQMNLQSQWLKLEHVRQCLAALITMAGGKTQRRSFLSFLASFFSPKQMLPHLMGDTPSVLLAQELSGSFVWLPHESLPRIFIQAGESVLQWSSQPHLSTGISLRRPHILAISQLQP